MASPFNPVGVLGEHEVEMPSKELNLLLNTRGEFGVLTANGPRDALENPRVEESPATDGDSVAAGVLPHFEGLLSGADISVANDRDALQVLLDLCNPGPVS